MVIRLYTKTIFKYIRFVYVYSELYLATVDMTDEQIMALILNYLFRRKCWGHKYFNTQKLTRYLGQDVLGDGKEVNRCLDELIKKWWIIPWKKGNTVSLNTNYKKEIMEHMEKYTTNEML